MEDDNNNSAEEIFRLSQESLHLSQEFGGIRWSQESFPAAFDERCFSNEFLSDILNSGNESRQEQNVEPIIPVPSAFMHSIAPVPSAFMHSIAPVPVYHCPESSMLSSACVPAKNSWTGDYGFDIDFAAPPKDIKGIMWIYSSVRNKLYVAKDAPCPINFKTSVMAPSNSVIRILPMFAHPDHVHDPVRRCINHAIDEHNSGMREAYHLVRCECNLAVYEKGDQGQLSVVVPFERPPIGQNFSTYILKFTCYGSCAGGPNRRPIMLIITLENGDVILGRRSLDIKICACPGRDFRNDNKPAISKDGNKENVKTKKRKSTPEPYSQHVSTLFNFIDNLSVDKKSKKEETSDKEEKLTVTATDRNMYRFLKQAKLLYEVCTTMQQFSPEIVRYLNSIKKARRDYSSTEGSD